MVSPPHVITPPKRQGRVTAGIAGTAAGAGAGATLAPQGSRRVSQARSASGA